MVFLQQIIKAALSNPLDTTQLSLIYANVQECDILLKKDLDELAAAHPLRFKVYYVLNTPPAGWTGGVGFVTKDMIMQHLPAPKGSENKMCLCGPPPMLAAMKNHLAEIGWEKPNTISKMPDQVFCF